MDERKTTEDKYLFNDIFDEVIENIENEDKSPDRPLCDSLANLNQHYKDFQPLAKGGMKRIFKVFDCKLNRYVAYACLHPNSPKELHDPFIREARLTALLEHPNIISVHDIGMREDDTPFFTMELKVGKNLGEIIREQEEGAKSGTEFFDGLLESFVKVCDAISFAHSKNVLHLDLKPENVQIGSFGEVIVCDWGLGKIIGDKDIEYDQLLFNPDLLNNVTRADKIVGTPGYMAPEQIEFTGNKNKQTDIYSLGAVLYTVLTGRSAFSGDVESILKDTISGQLTDPAKLELEWQVPASLSAVVLKAMSLDSEDRYQSVAELKKEVQNYLSGRTTVAEQAGLWKEFKLFYKRNLLTCNIVLSSLILIAFIGSVFLFKLQQKNVRLAAEKERAEENLKQAELERRRVKEGLDRMYTEKDLATALLGDEFERIRESFELVDSRVFKDPVNSLNDAERRLKAVTPENRAYRWAQKQLFYIYLIQQKFHDFEINFFTEKERKIDAKMIAEMAVAKKRDELAPIHLYKDFFKVCCDIPYFSGSALKMLKYDGKKRQSEQDHSVLVEIILRSVNKDWAGSFLFQNSSNYLKLSGKGLHRLSLEPKELFMRGGHLNESVCLIDSLPIKKLDISQTNVSHLWVVSRLADLEELVMKDVQFRDLEPLKYMKNLKKLTVTKGFFTAKELSQIPSQIVIEEVD